MRTDLKVATLSLAVLVGACSAGTEQAAALPDDLQKDLAVASAAAPGLAIAPKPYEATQVVSAVERSTAAPAKRLVASKKRTPKVKRLQASSAPKATETLPDPTTPGAEERPPESVATTPEPEAAPTGTEVVVEQPSNDPGAMPGGDTGVGDRGNGGSGDEGVGAGRSGGGLGGILGGIIGAVVIRGGHGGVDKCDPRTDGRRRGRGGIIMGRPDFGLPLPTGTTFPRSR